MPFFGKKRAFCSKNDQKLPNILQIKNGHLTNQMPVIAYFSKFILLLFQRIRPFWH